MEAGVNGVTGVFVLYLVVQGHRAKVVHVTTQHQLMEGKFALETMRKHKNATLMHAQLVSTFHSER